MAASFNALLEAHAPTLLPVFHRYRVGNMVVQRAGGSRVQLAESALARTYSESVRIFKQQQMGAIRRPTRRSTGRGFDFASPPPVNFSLAVRRKGKIMTIFNLILYPTYYNQGFFNVTVDYDRFVRSSEGPVVLRLGLEGPEIQGVINRRANRNGAPRIIGRPKLRDWFQKNYDLMGTVPIDLSSSETIVLHRQSEE